MMRFQFEATDNGNVLWGQMNDGFRITASIEVPNEASEDYGYLTMKKAILEEITARELDVDATFPYDGQEQFLEDDAKADVRVELDVTD